MVHLERNLQKTLRTLRLPSGIARLSFLLGRSVLTLKIVLKSWAVSDRTKRGGKNHLPVVPVVLQRLEVLPEK